MTMNKLIKVDDTSEKPFPKLMKSGGVYVDCDIIEKYWKDKE